MTPKVVVHTDVFLEHLTCSRPPSALRSAMGRAFCYTTVFHAMQLFAMAESPTERRAVEDAMAAMKVLGINARSAPLYGKLLAGRNTGRPLNVLIGGLCLESGLPILTDRPGDFNGIRGVRCVPTRMFRRR